MRDDINAGLGNACSAYKPQPISWTTYSLTTIEQVFFYPISVLLERVAPLLERFGNRALRQVVILHVEAELVLIRQSQI